jgi:hypothetical protein
MTVVTPKQVSDSVSSAVSKTIMDSIQTAQDQYSVLQNLNVTCDEEINDLLNTETNRCIEELNKQGYSNDMITKYCDIPVYCRGKNITMKSSANITDVLKQTSVISSNINNSVTNNISQNLSSLSPSVLSLIQGGGNITQKIKSITDIVTTNSSKIIQKIYNSTSQSQVLTLKNYDANNVSLSSIAKVTNNFLQTNKVYQSAITDIVNVISQVAKSGDNSLSTWIQRIFFVFIGIIVIIFMLIYFLKKRNTREFAAFILPYVILVSVLAVIISVNLKLKPAWVLKDNNETVKEIDYSKFLFYTIVPIIILAVIEYMYIKYRRKSQNDDEQ